MAKQEGYIYLDRSLCDHWIYADKPFDKARAWIDLIFLAHHKTHTRMYRGKLKTYKRGDVDRSISSLAKRWGWDRRKVRRFLDLLMADGMVQVNVTSNGTADGTANGTTITIVKYDDFQNKRTTNGTANGTSNGTANGTSDGTHTRNDKERNEVKEEREIKNTFGEYQHVKLTDRQLEKLISDYDRTTIDSAIKFLDEYIQEKGYKSKDHNLAIRRWVIDAVKDKQSKPKAKQNPFQNMDMKHDYDYDEMERKLLGW